MTRLKLKFIDHFKDRNGHLRYYFRRKGGVRIPLPGNPGSEEFMEAYYAALGGKVTPVPQRQRGEPGTFDRLLSLYFASPDFLRLRPQTQRVYRLVMERIVRDENIGHRSVGGMRREHVKKMLARRAGIGICNKFKSL